MPGKEIEVRVFDGGESWAIVSRRDLTDEEVAEIAAEDAEWGARDKGGVRRPMDDDRAREREIAEELQRSVGDE